MADRDHRKELREEYKQRQREAGVYRLLNKQNNKALLGSTLDLAAARNKLEFARSTNTPGALDLRLSKDIRQFGLEALSLEVLELLDITPEMTESQLRADLAALEELWREKMDPELLY